MLTILEEKKNGGWVTNFGKREQMVGERLAVDSSRDYEGEIQITTIGQVYMTAWGELREQTLYLTDAQLALLSTELERRVKLNAELERNAGASEGGTNT